MKKYLLALATALALIPLLATPQTNNFNILDFVPQVISGGTINNTPIGTTTPAGATFTTATIGTATIPVMVGNTTAANVNAGSLVVQGASTLSSVAAATTTVSGLTVTGVTTLATTTVSRLTVTTSTVLPTTTISVLTVGGSPVTAPLSGTTGAIGGSVLLAGACSSGNVTVTGVTTAMAIVATPSVYPGDGATWMGYPASANLVTVKVCAIVSATPGTSTYNVRAIQ